MTPPKTGGLNFQGPLSAENPAVKISIREDPNGYEGAVEPNDIIVINGQESRVYDFIVESKFFQNSTAKQRMEEVLTAFLPRRLGMWFLPPSVDPALKYLYSSLTGESWGEYGTSAEETHEAPLPNGFDPLKPLGIGMGMLMSKEQDVECSLISEMFRRFGKEGEAAPNCFAMPFSTPFGLNFKNNK